MDASNASLCREFACQIPKIARCDVSRAMRSLTSKDPTVVRSLPYNGTRLLCHSEGAKRRKNLKVRHSISRMRCFLRQHDTGDVSLSVFCRPFRAAMRGASFCRGFSSPVEGWVGGFMHFSYTFLPASFPPQIQTQTLRLLRLLQCYSVTVHNSEPKVCI